MTVPDPRRWRALAVLAVAQFMVVLDATIVNVALPSIHNDLQFSATSLQWVLNGYTLAFGGLLLFGGRLADLLGRRRLFLIGLTVFTGASLVAGFATSEGMLIVARVVQGVGAAALSPAALSIVLTLFPAGRERNTALGIWGALAGLGGTFGVVMGGLLVHAFGWGSVFFVNIPIGVLGGLAAFRYVAESRSQRRGGLDVAGAVAVTLAAAGLVYAIIGTTQYGWTSLRTVVLLAASAALGAAFVAIERRSQDPLVPLRLFRSRSLSTANVGQLLTGATFVSMFYLLTLTMQNLHGYSALETGFAFLPMGVAAIVSSGVAAQLVSRIGGKPVLVTGGVVSAVGLWLLSHVTVGGSYTTQILPGLIVFGLGLPMCFVPNTIASQVDVGGDDNGVSSGLVNASSQIGGSIGLAVVVTVATSRGTALAHQGASSLGALAGGFHAGYLLAAGIALVGAVFGLVAAPNVRPNPAALLEALEAEPIPVPG
jgi:EmrB/QacA subfamily drug resistance transporter